MQVPRTAAVFAVEAIAAAVVAGYSIYATAETVSDSVLVAEEKEVPTANWILLCFDLFLISRR